MLVALGSRCASDLASDSFALKPRQNLLDFTRAYVWGFVPSRLYFLQRRKASGKRQESVCTAGIEEEPHDGAGLEPGGGHSATQHIARKV